MPKPHQIHASAFTLGLNFMKDLSAGKLLENRSFYIDAVMVLWFLKLVTGFSEDLIACYTSGIYLACLIYSFGWYIFALGYLCISLFWSYDNLLIYVAAGIVQEE